MKNSIKILSIAAGATLLLASVAARAESTYGYKTDGTAAVATARINVKVTVPKLILLRVGSAGSVVDTVTFTATPTVGSTNPTWAVGNSQAVEWDGAAPTFLATGGSAVTAYLWHNNASKAQLACTSALLPAGSSFAISNFTVGSGTGAGALAHPGSDLSCTSMTTGLAPNTLFTGTWTYGVIGLNAALAGSMTVTTTYTANTL